jgi:hypothetical protein
MTEAAVGQRSRGSFLEFDMGDRAHRPPLHRVVNLRLFSLKITPFCL